jgi:fatty-acyl-CoA synthase
MSGSCLDPFLLRSRESPDSLAFLAISKGSATALTWRSLAVGAGRYASALRDLGVQRDDVVIILLDHGVDQYFAFIGAMLIGAIPSFMPPLSNKQIPSIYWPAHAQLFARIKPRALIIAGSRESELRQFIPANEMAILAPENVGDKSFEPSPSEAVQAADIAFLQHSSGTTQLKKGVQLTHGAVLSQVTAYTAALQLRDSDRIASWLPLYHDMGLIACFIMPIVAGVPVVALDPFEWVIRPESLLSVIEEHRCTLAWMPNFAFHHLVRTRQPGTRYELGNMRAWIDCSEPCRAGTFDSFAQTFADCGVAASQLQVCYAMAETVFAISQTEIGSPVRRLHVNPTILQDRQQAVPAGSNKTSVELLSAGRPLANINVTVVDSTGEPLPEGRVGEIVVEGDFVFSGYYRLPDQTMAKLHGGRCYTNDLGFLWDGELYVLGRADDMIVINGRNFFAHEIEYIVSALPGVRPGRNVVFAIDAAVAGTNAAVLVCEAGEIGFADALRLKREIREVVSSAAGLALHDVRFVPTGWLVKTTSGKISRYDNRAKYLSEQWYP